MKPTIVRSAIARKSLIKLLSVKSNLPESNKLLERPSCKINFIRAFVYQDFFTENYLKNSQYKNRKAF